VIIAGYTEIHTYM